MKTTLIINRETQVLLTGEQHKDDNDILMMNNMLKQWAETAIVNFERDGGFGFPKLDNGQMTLETELNLCDYDLQYIKENNTNNKELFLDLGYLLELNEVELEAEFENI